MNGRTGEFVLDPAVTYLNHASFGCPTRAGLDRAEATRRSIELDTAIALGPGIVQGLARQADAVASHIGAAAGSVALVENTTAAGAALWASLPFSAETCVLTFDVEYESVIRGLEVACGRGGATLIVAHVPLPVTREAVLHALTEARPAPTVVVMSAVTSSTAVAMPVQAVAEWCGEHGVQLLIDAAHVVGHVPLDVETLGADAVFGSLHKWLPVPRSVGFLWLAPELRDVVRPAEVTFRWDEESLADRFGWRGTWDPASALGVEAALAEHAAWDDAGDLERAAEVADEIAALLRDEGLIPTAGKELTPPRLRAFSVPGAPLADLRAALLERGARVWTGSSADSATLLRIATHIYSEAADAGPVIEAVRKVLRLP